MAELGLVASDNDIAVPAPALQLVGEQTFWTLARNSWRAYWANVRVIVSCALFPVLPFFVMQEVWVEKSNAWKVVVGFGYFVSLFLTGCALTFVLSDICLGNAPTLKRAFSRIFRRDRWLSVMSTGFLVSALTLFGALALVVPALWLAVRGMFAYTVVAIEGRSNWDAIQRSFELTKGQSSRLLSLLVPVIIALFVTIVALAVIIAMALNPVLAGSQLAMPVAQICMFGLSSGILSPMLSIYVVQLYYEQRVRREFYNARALSEDLAR